MLQSTHQSNSQPLSQGQSGRPSTFHHSTVDEACNHYVLFATSPEDDMTSDVHTYCFALHRSFRPMAPEDVNRFYAVPRCRSCNTLALNISDCSGSIHYWDKYVSYASVKLSEITLAPRPNCPRHAPLVASASKVLSIMDPLS